mgnify:CR=1 FL=1
MIRSMLEGLCVRWATEHITQEQLEELDEIILYPSIIWIKDIPIS